MDCQDWSPLKIQSTTATAIASAKKMSSGRMKVTPGAAQARKIDTADAPIKLKQLATESRQEIIQKRLAMKKNQSELNTLCAFAPNTIRDIEAGKLTPSPGQLNNLNRILKASLKMV